MRSYLVRIHHGVELRPQKFSGNLNLALSPEEHERLMKRSASPTPSNGNDSRRGSWDKAERRTSLGKGISPQVHNIYTPSTPLAAAHLTLCVHATCATLFLCLYPSLSFTPAQSPATPNFATGRRASRQGYELPVARECVCGEKLVWGVEFVCSSGGGHGAVVRLCGVQSHESGRLYCE